MDNEVQDRMVIMPADKQGVYTKQEIQDAAVFTIHIIMRLTGYEQTYGITTQVIPY